MCGYSKGGGVVQSAADLPRAQTLFRPVFRHPSALAGLVLALAFVAACIASPLLALLQMQQRRRV